MRAIVLYLLLATGSQVESNAGTQQAPEPSMATTEGQLLPLQPIGDVIVDADGDTIPDRLDQRARVRGVVTIPPGIIADQFFQTTIQDDSGGITLFSYEFSLPLKPGDFVEAVGTVGQYRGAIQLKDVFVERIGEESVPGPIPLTIAEAASWSYFGRLVAVRGTAGTLDMTTFGILPLTSEDGSFVSLYFPQRIIRNFPFDFYQEGAEIEAIGVVSMLNNSWPYDSGFQVVITRPDQIRVIQKAPPPWQIWVKWGIAALVAIIVLTGMVIYLLQRRQRERKLELATLNALTSTLSAQGLGRDELARRACEALIQHGLFDVLIVHAFDDEGQLRMICASGVDDLLARQLDFGPQDDDDGEVPRLIESKAATQAMADHDLTLVTTISLTAHNRTFGIITVFSSGSHTATATQERTLLAGAKMISLVLENIEVRRRAEVDRKELKQLAITDDLTKLYNRRFLDEYLRIQMAMVMRRKGGLAFFAIDLDHFKKINDTWGHDAGDQVLIHVADQLRESTRASDLPVRYGGEEFLVVVTDTDADGARRYAERLRAQIEGLKLLDIVPEQELKVTASIGVAVFPTHGESSRDLLGACDQALYQSKNEGRNRVTMSGDKYLAQQPTRISP